MSAAAGEREYGAPMTAGRNYVAVMRAPHSRSLARRHAAGPPARPRSSTVTGTETCFLVFRVLRSLRALRAEGFRPLYFPHVSLFPPSRRRSSRPRFPLPGPDRGMARSVPPNRAEDHRRVAVE